MCFENSKAVDSCSGQGNSANEWTCIEKNSVILTSVSTATYDSLRNIR